MCELEKMMCRLPKLIYEKVDGSLFVAGFQSQHQTQNQPLFKHAKRYFREMLSLYNGEKDDTEYKKQLVCLYKKVRNYIQDFPVSITQSRNYLEQLSTDDITQVSKQIEMYKYVRSIYSDYN